MQLNEILEENSVKSISQKTKISESNLENLIAGKFEALQKTKALGFIAIIEREYHADLGRLREEALEYYSAHREDSVYATRHYLDEEKKGKSKFVTLLVLGLLAYATWYFLTQFDKKNLSGLIPFIDEAKLESMIKSDEAAEDLSIAKVTVEDGEVEPLKKEEAAETTESQNVASLVESLVEEDNSEQNSSDIFLKSVFIEPVNKLWFGLVDTETKERNHFSIDEGYVIEIGDKTWLLATSSAPFSLVQGDNIQEFKDAKEHYFKIDKNGVMMLNKSEYVEQGGWHQW